MADTRISRTSTGQYDMLLAISQRSVNQALESMWEVEGDNLEDLEYDGGVFGSLKAKISGVRVQVLADGSGRGSVLVRLIFHSGKAVFVDRKGKTGVPLEMKDWIFCFKADIGLNDIHNAIKSDEAKLAKPSDYSEEALEEAKKRLEFNKNELLRFGERAGDYSIQRLFVDFTNANYSAFVEAECLMPNLPPAMKGGFSKLVGDWLIENKTEDKSVIGYGLSVDKKDVAGKLKVADCLIPSQLVLNTYAYKATPESDVVLGWSKDSDSNCIVYSDMTENRQVGGERMLQWSGNFTTADMADKERRIDGSMCLRRGLFLDKFVIPMLKQYNDDMQIVPDKMEFSRDGSAGQRRYHWSFGATLGYNKDQPDWRSSYFDFTENQKGAQFSKIQGDPLHEWAKQQGFDSVTSTSGVSWSWDKSISLTPGNINEDWHFPQDICNWTDHLGGSQIAMAHVDVVPDPGSGLIKLRGISKTEIKMNGYYTRLTDHNLDYSATYTVTCFWQVNYNVIQEKDSLGCKVIMSKCFTKVDDSDISGDFRAYAGHEQGEKFCKTLLGDMPKMLEGKKAVAQAINDSLNATGKFTHPATGSFNIYDPMFNERGDLLASVRYNAPSAAEKLNKKKFALPSEGKEVEQPGPSDPSKQINVVGDITAPIGNKGS